MNTIETWKMKGGQNIGTEMFVIFRTAEYKALKTQDAEYRCETEKL